MLCDVALETLKYGIYSLLRGPFMDNILQYETAVISLSSEPYQPKM